MAPLTLSTPLKSTLPALDLLRIMALSREGDRREGILLRQSRGWFQVSGMGHEPIAALAYLLKQGDVLYPYYRDRALCLARGLTNYDLALAYFAKRESSSGGRHMPGHFSSRDLGIFSVATPTASQCLPAAGHAWALKMDGTDNIAVTTVGDAAIRQGEFYEAVTFAVQEKLPLITVVEDNQFGISTPTQRFNPYRLGVFHPDTYVHVDARDPQNVFDAGMEAAAKARRGDGPTVLWCELDRLSSHTSSDDHRVYRAAEEIAEMLKRDPIPMLALRLMDAGEITAEEWEAELEAMRQKVEEEYLRAEQAADVEPHRVMDFLMAPPKPVSPPPVSPGEATTMVAAVNETLHAALTENDHVVMLGEDIEDPKGGVFGLTKGLSAKFPERVFNAPLAEATIVGVAVGLAAGGYKPVFEIQFIDFLAPAMNQLMTQVATLRWRSVGDWSCPMVLFAPCGAYLPGGSLWHSQSNESMWAHIPGLNVVVPSTPEDAAGLMWTAIHSDDPTLFLVPKHIFRKRVVVDAFPAVPFGKCSVRRAGTDVSLVTWGNCTELAEEAAGLAEAEGISVEIVDLRSIAPCDFDGVAASVSKTGRLVVLYEDVRTGGFGQSIVSEMVAHADRWNLFLSPPQIVARMDTHIPYCPTLEYTVLPNIDQVMDAIRTTMQ